MGNITEKKYNSSQTVCIHNTKKKSEVSFVTPNPKPLLFARVFTSLRSQRFRGSESGKKEESKNRNEGWERGENKKQRFLHVFLFSSPFLHFLAY